MTYFANQMHDLSTEYNSIIADYVKPVHTSNTVIKESFPVLLHNAIDYKIKNAVIKGLFSVVVTNIFDDGVIVKSKIEKNYLSDAMKEIVYNHYKSFGYIVSLDDNILTISWN